MSAAKAASQQEGRLATLSLINFEERAQLGQEADRAACTARPFKLGLSLLRRRDAAGWLAGWLVAAAAAAAAAALV